MKLELSLQEAKELFANADKDALSLKKENDALRQMLVSLDKANADLHGKLNLAEEKLEAFIKMDQKLPLWSERLTMEWGKTCRHALSNEQETNFLVHLLHGQKISAIKLWREWTGANLKECKDVVERIIA